MFKNTYHCPASVSLLPQLMIITEGHRHSISSLEVIHSNKNDDLLPFNPFRTTMHYCVCQDIISRHIITQYNPAFRIPKGTSAPRTCRCTCLCWYRVANSIRSITLNWLKSITISYIVFCNLKSHTFATRFMVMLVV